MEVVLNMTYKQIEASREVRLWITQVIVPVFGIAMLFPECRNAVVTKANDVADLVKRKFHK
jgi:hypothetical protein